MFYQNLKFPKVKDRPFFYTNFVQTLDGKVAVKKPGYWPIGSKKDYSLLIELRAYADALIHGGNLAREFGEVTLRNINGSGFKALRKKLGKNPDLPYYVVSTKPESFKKSLGWQAKSTPRVSDLIGEFQKKGYKYILVEGGPTLLGSFLKEDLIDEIFLTIAPKIFGTEEKTTLNLIEGILFSPQNYKKLKLVSVKKFGNEVFLRYKLR